GNRDREEPEVAHGMDDLDGESPRPVPLGGVRLDLAGGEVAHHGAQLIVLVGEVGGHAAPGGQTGGMPWRRWAKVRSFPRAWSMRSTSSRRRSSGSTTASTTSSE